MGGGAVRAFDISAGATVSISALRIEGGEGTYGGNIKNAGNLTLSAVELSAGNAGAGAGVYNTGTVTINDSTISDNTSSSGGGIYNGSTGTVTINDSTVSGNTGNLGGGIYNAGLLTLDAVEVDSNSGGGIYMQSNQGATLDVSNSTIAENVGGGIYLNYGGQGAVNITNSTISSNTGSGFYWSGGTSAGTTFVNVTVTNNTSTGIHSEFGVGPTLHNTIVVGNGTTAGYDLYRSFNTASSFNFIGTQIQGGLTDGVNNNRVGVIESEVILAALDYYGGPTRTHALQAGSTAIDGGSDAQAASAGLTTDQRGTGYTRAIDRSFDGGNTVDVGAYETADITVSTDVDENDTDYTIGDLSLREALELAEANPGPEVITFAPSLGGYIELQLGALNIASGTVDIIGPGAEQMYIDGIGYFSVFNISAGATVSISALRIEGGEGTDGGNIKNAGTLTLSAVELSAGSADAGSGVYNTGTLTIQDGSTISGGGSGDGGGIYNTNSGTVTINDSTVSGNTGNSGGGIYNDSTGTVTINDSTISGNTGSLGGGIYNGSTGTVMINDSTVSGNTGSLGGGIYNAGTATLDNAVIHDNDASSGGGMHNTAGATLTAENSSITSNTSTAGSGGGVNTLGLLTIDKSTIEGNSAFIGGGVSVGAGGKVTLLSSSVIGNSAVTRGGGLENSSFYTYAILKNSTFSGNTTSGDGGGISNSGRMVVYNVTVTENRSDDDEATPSETGGGISTVPGTNVFTLLRSTLVAGNYQGTGIVDGDLSGTYHYLSSGNLIGASDGTNTIADGVLGNQVGTPGSPIDPLLGALADNGGPTKTYALLAGSSAIDGGDNAFNHFTGDYDQRGMNRVAYGMASSTSMIDIGAYEWQPTTFVVDENGDGITANGTTSIREALLEANSDPDFSLIVFGTGFTNPTINMGTSAELQINSDVKLLGESYTGTGTVTFDGQRGTGGTGRLFNIAAGVNAAISGVIIKSGSATNGAGVQNAGTLFLDHVIIQDNAAPTGTGGGIYNLSGAFLAIGNSLLTDNDALIGGAICSDGDLEVVRTSIQSNTAYVGGGLVITTTGNLTLTDTTVAYNVGSAGGGGIVTAGSTTIINSTISTNTTDGGGGGIWQSAGTLYTYNATITNNRSNVDDSVSGDLGGGIYKSSVSSTATLYNTIVAGNNRGTATPVADDLAGTFSGSSLNNLIGLFSSGGGIVDGVNGNMVGTGYNLNLGALASNGGPTLTHELQLGSAAIDAGHDDYVFGEYDQRGDPYKRQIEGYKEDFGPVDIGAYEYGGYI